jgi:hypothetical protein
MEKQEIKTSFKFIEENCKKISDCIALEKKINQANSNGQKEVFLKS